MTGPPVHAPLTVLAVARHDHSDQRGYHSDPRTPQASAGLGRGDDPGTASTGSGPVVHGEPSVGKPVLCLQAVDQRLRGLKQGHEDRIRHVTGLERS